MSQPARLTPNQRARLGAITKGAENDARVEIDFASDISPSEPRWLWDGRIPLGEVTALVGRQGLGKSTAAIDLAARVTRGAVAGHCIGEPGSVLYVADEDTPGTTLVPRLRASQGDAGRLAFVRVENAGLSSTLTLPEHTEQVAEHARQIGAKLLVLDPIKSFVGSKNPDRETEVRAVLAPLVRMASRLDLAVLAILHMNKSEAENILDRVAGSGAWTQVARSVLFLGIDPDDPRGERGPNRVLAHAKCNLGPLSPSRACRLEAVTLNTDIPTMRCSRMVVEGTTGLTARDVIETDVQRSERREAIAFLQHELKPHPQPVKELIKRARAIGIDQRTLYRAKAELRVKARPDHFVGWEWELP